MPTAFTDKANFSGISTSRSLAISSVIHQVLFEVQETGIEMCEERGKVFQNKKIYTIDNNIK